MSKEETPSERYRRWAEGKHPKGLCPEDKVIWHLSCERLFQLYKKMESWTTERQVIGGVDEGDEDIVLVMFKGDVEDLKEIRKLLG